MGSWPRARRTNYRPYPPGISPATKATSLTGTLWSRLVSRTTCQRASVTARKLEGVSISPNPATDRFSLKLKTSNGTSSRVEIIDINGRILMSQTMRLPAGTTMIELPESPAETYFLRVVNDGKAAVLRFA